jgi:hypothetical protein
MLLALQVLFILLKKAMTLVNEGTPVPARYLTNQDLLTKNQLLKGIERKALHLVLECVL